MQSRTASGSHDHPLTGRTVLVTGAGGFIGSALVERLSALGARIRALLGPASESLSLRKPSNAEQIAFGHLSDVALVRSLLEDVEIAFHLAGPPSVAMSFEQPSQYLQVHTVGTVTLLELSELACVRRFVYVSSAEVYDARVVNSGQRVNESHVRGPSSPYGIAKFGAELVLEQLSSADMQVSIMRPFSVYGPGGSPHSLVGTLTGGAAAGRNLAIMDPRPIRDYCYVDDVVDGLIAASIRSGERVRAYNVASGRGVSALELARIVARAAGRSEKVGEATRKDRPEHAVTLELVGDPDRAFAELGFCTRTTLEEGLARTLAWATSRVAGPALHR